MIPERINQISTQPGFPFWFVALHPNKMCELVRSAGFSVEPDHEHINIFLPQKMFDILEPILHEGAPVSFLMASLKDFESYQVKGIFKRVRDCTVEEIQEHQSTLGETISETNKFGLNGQEIFGYLMTPPIKCIRVQYKEVFEQTPKPGTGTRLNEEHEA